MNSIGIQILARSATNKSESRAVGYTGICRGYIRVILGLYRDNGKQKRSEYNRVYIGALTFMEWAPQAGKRPWPWKTRWRRSASVRGKVKGSGLGFRVEGL